MSEIVVRNDLNIYSKIIAQYDDACFLVLGIPPLVEVPLYEVDIG